MNLIQPTNKPLTPPPFLIPTYTFSPFFLCVGEGDACILALMQLRSAVTDYPALELRTMKHLVCNFKAWSRCSFKFQSSLVSVVATTVSAQPEYFQAHIGVQGRCHHSNSSLRLPHSDPSPSLLHLEPLPYRTVIDLN